MSSRVRWIVPALFWGSVVMWLLSLVRMWSGLAHDQPSPPVPWPQLAAFTLFFTAVLIRRRWHPTVQPTGRILTPVPATGGASRTFALRQVQGMNGSTWTSSWRWRRPQLVIEPGWVRLVRTWLPKLSVRDIELAQPLLNRRERPGIVLHLYGGRPVLVLLDEPREQVLTELAAAGFRVDGAEQMVSRRWRRG